MGIKHDVDYNVKTVETIDALSQRVDDLRLTALANLEQLHQFLDKNRNLVNAANWSLTEMQSQLEICIKILNTKI